MLSALIVLAVNSIQAQVQNNKPLYIADNSYMYVGSGTYFFGSGDGETMTSRTPSANGKLIFSNLATTSGASDSHFLNGYGSVITTNPFVFPVGQSGVYAPLAVTPSTIAPIDVAYFRAGANTIGTTLDPSVAATSSVEYWNVNTSNTAIVTLTWRASSLVSDFVTSTDDLTIIGYDGAKWNEIVSTVDDVSIIGGASSLTSGSITSSGLVNLTNYNYLSLGLRGNSCAPLVASSGTTKTWIGTWLPSAPSLSDPVIISVPYSAGSFACNSLVLDADITLTDGQSVEVVNGVTGSGKLVMSSEASFVQRASDVGVPNIELTKRTRNVMRAFDYVYWGTPISGNFFSQLADAQANTATVADAFDLKYQYVSGTGGGLQTLTAIETGKGFITRVKSQTPFSNATNTDYINFKLTGLANNGDITVPVTNNPALPEDATSHVLLANPYPSAIDSEKFLTENTNVDGVIYIWTTSTLNNGNGSLTSQADYIAHTLAGTVMPNATPTYFDGKIASAQGFKVKSLVNSGTVTFTNCMRITNDNNQFYRTNQLHSVSEVRDRFKLNMTGPNAVFSQILVSYTANGTLGYDRMYDAGRNSVSTAQLFSVFEGDGRKLAINARPTFFDTDVVPIGVSKQDASPESFTISITEKEGVFTTPDVDVYIHDILNDTYHDLNTGDFTFSSDQTSLLGRYEIVYQSTLSNTEFQNGTAVATIKDNVLNVKANQEMTSIEVFDLVGRKIFSSAIENQTIFSAPFYHAQATYIVKIRFNDGKVISTKLIN
jgi:hypothetical protein